ncbi:MAG: extracellular solute-binding protein, partial [Bacillota bacterium]|nr:extracellular solute-binding protein [Bacillota bacterium]
MYYDKSVLSDQDVTSFEQTLKVCDSKGKEFAMDAGNGYYASMFMFTGGMTLGFDEANFSQICNYNEQKVTDSLKAFATAIRGSKSFSSMAVTSGVSGMQNGNVAALIDGTWDAPAIKKALGSNFGVVKLPTININGQNTQMVDFLGYRALGVNINTKFPATAHALAAYLSSKDCQEQLASNLEICPSNIEALNDSAIASDPVISAMKEQQKNSIEQTEISGCFWDPVASVGSYLYEPDGNPIDDASLKALLKDTMSAIEE